MVRFKCNLLSSIWLSDHRKLRELSYWLHVMRRPQGWHYDMDEAWILHNLEAASLPAGATVMDAGAGLGVMQYVLAARGYNVVSLDFGKRIVPNESKGIFDLTLDRQETFEYRHPYQDQMSFTQTSSNSIRGMVSSGAFCKLLTRHLPRRLYFKLKREFLHLYYRRHEKSRPHEKYGRITFVRAAFHEMPYPDSFFDAVVSVSALEHADIRLLDVNLSELVRVAKQSAPILITTSATDQKEDFFHEKTQGWCFASDTIQAFAPNAVEEYRNYPDVERSILASTLWRSRLDPYYHLDSSSGFYGKQVMQLPYLPIGLSVAK